MFRKSQSGFTLLELIIATSIFSVVLLLLAFGLVQIGRTYYSGINRSRTQAVSRNISDNIIQGVQFSDGTITLPPAVGAVRHFCIGSKTFTYELNKKRDDGSGAFRLKTNNTGPCTASDLTTTPSVNEQELLPKGMRVLKLDLTLNPATNLYRLELRIAKGEDDMLIDSASPVPKRGNEPGFDYKNASCASGAGSQFCSVAELVTNIQRRL